MKIKLHIIKLTKNIPCNLKTLESYLTYYLLEKKFATTTHLLGSAKTETTLNQFLLSCLQK